jgi:hypothetical protein
VSEDIDDRVADGEDVETNICHACLGGGAGGL